MQKDKINYWNAPPIYDLHSGNFIILFIISHICYSMCP